MRAKKAAVLIIVVLAVIIFCITLVRATIYIPDSGTYAPPQAASSTMQTVAPTSNPVRLDIPSLSIDAYVQDVGLTKTGDMGVPNNFTDVAWYKYGTVPGQPGSAVIDGHVDNALSLPGVFKHLADIQVGDDVYVETASSTKLHFIVTDVESYPVTSVPLQRIFNTTGGTFLNLITCSGSWNQPAKEYDHRLVVFTKLANF